MAKTFIALPCFNEGENLSNYLEELPEFNDRGKCGSVEILLCDDGSSPPVQEQMRRVVERISVRIPPENKVSLSLATNPLNRGKGATLRDAFRRALLDEEVTVLGFLDGDGSVSFRQAERLLNRLQEDASLGGVIGSRWRALGRLVTRSTKRHLAGRVYATLVSHLFSIPVYDSQCGAKFFRRSVLDYGLLELCRDDRWLFDTQLLLASHARGVVIEEVPVDWHDKPNSKISLFADSVAMGWKLFRFRRHLQQHLGALLSPGTKEPV